MFCGDQVVGWSPKTMKDSGGAMVKKTSYILISFLVRLVEKKAGIEPEIHEGQIGPAIQAKS